MCTRRDMVVKNSIINLPTPISSSQQCGGGPIRLLQVSINNQIVGMIVPYPTVYTGGINPMLWRPLTGIESLNVVPYRFDLSPFMGLFHDLLFGMGNTTIDIGIQVVTGEGIGSSSIDQENLTHEGVWSLDSTLIFYHDHSDNKAAAIPMYDTFSSSIYSQPQTTIQLINNSSGYNISLTNQFTLLASSSRNTKQTLNITYEIDILLRFYHMVMMYYLWNDVLYHMASLDNGLQRPHQHKVMNIMTARMIRYG